MGRKESTKKHSREKKTTKDYANNGTQRGYDVNDTPQHGRRGSSVMSSTRSTSSDSDEYYDDDDDTASSVTLDSILIQMAEEWSSDEGSWTSETEDIFEDSGRSRRRRLGPTGDTSSSRRSSRKAKKKKKKKSHQKSSDVWETKHLTEVDVDDEGFLNVKGEFIKKHGNKSVKALPGDLFPTGTSKSTRSMEFEDIEDNRLNYINTTVSEEEKHDSRYFYTNAEDFAPIIEDSTDSPELVEGSNEVRSRRRSKKMKRRKPKSRKASRRRSSSPVRRQKAAEFEDAGNHNAVSPIQFRSSLMKAVGAADAPNSSNSLPISARNKTRRSTIGTPASTTAKRNRVRLVMREGMELPLVSAPPNVNRRSATGSVASVKSNTNEWMIRELIMSPTKLKETQVDTSGGDLDDNNDIDDERLLTNGSSHSATRSRTSYRDQTVERHQRKPSLLRAFSKRFVTVDRRSSFENDEAEQSLLQPTHAPIRSLADELLPANPRLALRRRGSEPDLSATTRRRTSSADYSVPLQSPAPMRSRQSNLEASGRQSVRTSRYKRSGSGDSVELLNPPRSQSPTPSEGSNRRSWLQRSTSSANRQSPAPVTKSRYGEPKVTVIDESRAEEIKAFTPTELNMGKDSVVAYSDRVMKKTLRVAGRSTSVSPTRERPKRRKSIG